MYMKKVILSFFSVFLFCFCSYAQCNTQIFTDKGIKHLTSAGGYTFLKSYPVKGEQGKKYSYIFSTGTKYLITLANSNANTKGLVITILDSNNSQIATSFANDKYYPALGFTCKKTGIYHLKFSFNGTKDYCAAGVLGMKR